MRIFALALFFVIALPAFAADKAFQVTWTPSGQDAGATSVTVQWLVNGVKDGLAAVQSGTATSTSKTLTVSDGDTVTAEIVMSNSNGSTTQAPSVTAVVGSPPAFTATVQQID